MTRVIGEYLVDEIEGGYLLLNSKSGREYRVSPSIPFCECPDFQFRKRECKHLELIKTLEGKKIKEKEGEKEGDKEGEKGIEVEVKVKDKPLSASESLTTSGVDEVRGGLVEVLKADDYDEYLITEQVIGAEPLVYVIPAKTGTRYILSIKGVTLAAAIQGNIRVDWVKVETIPWLGERPIGIARALDLKRNIARFGYAERFHNRDFMITTLTSKAQRNAVRAVLLPHIEQKVIEQALTAKSVLIL
jgi:hypothetical protein